MKDKKNKIFGILLLVNLLMPVVVNAAGETNKMQVMLIMFALISPVMLIAIIINIVVNKGKKDAKKDLRAVTNNKDKLKIKEVEETIKKSTPAEKVNNKKTFKLDFKNDEKIEKKLEVDIYSEKTEKFKPYKIVLTKDRLGILKEDDSLHLETKIADIKNIRKKTNEDDTYNYTFKNKKIITIKSKDLQEILKDKLV